MIRFGPAGWSYKDWQGVVYPEDPPKGFDPLAFLARYFDTIEVNSTFYRPPRPEVTPRWARRVAENPDFKFTAKLWQRFTHERDSAPSADEVAAVRAGLDPLVDRGRLGGLLIQFPWSFKAGDESLDWLDDVTSTFSDYPCVVEVRHASWNKPTFYRWLGERGVGFVNIDQPLFHRSIGPSAEASGCVGYVRLHGRNYDDWFREGAGRDARACKRRHGRRCLRGHQQPLPRPGGGQRHHAGRYVPGKEATGARDPGRCLLGCVVWVRRARLRPSSPATLTLTPSTAWPEAQGER